MGTTNQIELGIIGGSGLYKMEGLKDAEKLIVDTPFGAPSSDIIVGTLEGLRVGFLARHGAGHIHTPGEINYRANIYALKQLGATKVVSISACGSLREDFSPGNIVIPDQLFDFTKDRKRSFFEDGFVAHIGVADPFCPEFSSDVYQAVINAGGKARKGGKAITIEGPRFSTKGESQIFRGWGLDVIGMTTSPEAFLAREAELCYAVMFHITDYDVWHQTEEAVSVELVIEILEKNISLTQKAIRELAKTYNAKRTCTCQNALENAFITNPKLIPDETYQKLELLVGKYHLKS
ncbi:S-methyl-5'-thioadenosine phosphorylase [bacterium]|nr:S-methyl-5'-thioadenosine phosphorylase [bacterium]